MKTVQPRTWLSAVERMLNAMASSLAGLIAPAPRPAPIRVRRDRRAGR